MEHKSAHAVMNRGSRRGPLFESQADYDRFDWLLRTALIKRPLRRLDGGWPCNVVCEA
jgi:hypothetical protein